MSRKLQESVRKRKGTIGEKGEKKAMCVKKGELGKEKRGKGEKRKRPRVCWRKKGKVARIEKG